MDEEKEILIKELNALRENLMTFASIRMTYADEQIGNLDVTRLLDSATLDTIKTIRSIILNVGKS